MKKKILSGVLAGTVLCSLVPAAFAANEGFDHFQKTRTYSAGQFTDVKETDWYGASVRNAYELGLVNGSTATTYNPSGNITVVETLALACRIHSTYVNDGYVFAQSSPWYQCYLDYAEENGIVYPAGSKMTAPADRTEFAYILSNALPQNAFPAKNHISELPDVTASNEAYDQIMMLYNAGVLAGSDKYGSFHPDSRITRKEVSTIIERMAVPTLRKVFTLEAIPNYEVRVSAATKDLKYEIADCSFTTYASQYSGNRFEAIIGLKNTGKTAFYINTASFDIEDRAGHLLQTEKYPSQTLRVVLPNETVYIYNQGSSALNDDISVDEDLNLVAQLRIEKAKEIPARYAISDTAINKGGFGGFSITGRITNDTDEDVGIIYPRAILFDANHKVIGITGVNITDLYANSTASFEISGMLTQKNATYENIASFEIIAEEMYFQY